MYISNRTSSKATPGPVPLLGHVDLTYHQNIALLADLDWEEGISLFKQVTCINNQRQGDLPNLALMGRCKDGGPINVSGREASREQGHVGGSRSVCLLQRYCR